ncbi:PREDICTED: transmembrane and TPR repeat-containing protein 3-like [Priapulus caudatus]|uniref:dolichyl-phosphate-mannose--protein mannosyltransferase n=1 Tax=Priapulus caudatus TaxID=37621 RepID=A0ABM1DU06_PRICU|nr:PREDICTED: transmembrane and TPR repeat-containing protein 3-like [Priapulus caudatus]
MRETNNNKEMSTNCRDRKTIFHSLVLITTALLCYYNSLGCGFVFDDVSAIKDNKDIRPSSPLSNLFFNDFWGTPMQKEESHKSYRPLCVLTFRWNFAMGKLDPWGYHLGNILLHAVVCVLYYRLSAREIRTRSHPHSPTSVSVVSKVTGVVGRAELLSSTFFLSAFLSYANCSGRRKETGDDVKVIELLYLTKAVANGKIEAPDWLKASLLRLVVLCGCTLLLLAARMEVMGAKLPVFTQFDNPAAAASFPARQLTFNYLLPVNFGLLLWPSTLLCDWTMGTIPLVETPLDGRNLATLVFYMAVFHAGQFALSHNGDLPRQVIMALALLIFPFLPACNLFFTVGFVVAERVLYMPSMGFCILLAIGWQVVATERGLKSIACGTLVVTLLLHSSKTVARNREWQDEYTLFMSGLKVTQSNAKLFNNVGHALETQERHMEALGYFRRAARIQPDDIGAFINIGRAYASMRMYREAETAYKRAMVLMPQVRPGQTYQTRIAPGYLSVYVNLANLISKNESRLEEADALYRQAISMRNDMTQALINRLDPRLDPLAVVLVELKRHDEALDYFEKALQFDPDHRQSLMNSAVLIQESGNQQLRPLAYQRLFRLLELEPSNEKIYFNLGILGMDDKDFRNAEIWFKKAIEEKEDFRSALFNLALLLSSEMEKPLEAVPNLQQLLKYYPDHHKGLILLGDIYLNNLHDIANAEKCFEKVLETDKDHVQARHNLCVVYVERGSLREAERCLAGVLALAPREDYVRAHLSIVRTKVAELTHEQSSSSATATGRLQRPGVLPRATRFGDVAAAAAAAQHPVKVKL